MPTNPFENQGWKRKTDNMIDGGRGQFLLHKTEEEEEKNEWMKVDYELWWSLSLDEAFQVLIIKFNLNK